MPAPSPADDAERAPPRLAVVGGTDLLDFEADMLARVRQLRVGDWLHLQDASGRMEPAKVSWVSPISSRLLLVNRRGMRKMVVSPEELAALVGAGRVVVRAVDAQFDEAMKHLWQQLNAANDGAISSAAG